MAKWKVGNKLREAKTSNWIMDDNYNGASFVVYKKSGCPDIVDYGESSKEDHRFLVMGIPKGNRANYFPTLEEAKDYAEAIYSKKDSPNWVRTYYGPSSSTFFSPTEYYDIDAEGYPGIREINRTSDDGTVDRYYVVQGNNRRFRSLEKAKAYAEAYPLIKYGPVKEN